LIQFKKRQNERNLSYGQRISQRKIIIPLLFVFP
jgi:hypothetical protein